MKLTEILSIESLEIGYITGKYNNNILPPLNSKACKGELIAIIGRNGIGKSTLLRTLAGLQPSLGGEIFYSGKNLKEYSRTDLAQMVGYISTEIVKVTNMTVYNLVALGRFPHTNWIGRIDREDHEVIMDALEKTSMSAFSSRFVSELSDGERQRAMIARILAQDTGIMIMDEPTAFLDIGSKYEVLHLMHALSLKSEKCIIFSTHDLQMAISQSDKIWLLTDKNLVEGAPEDLMIAGAFDHIFDSSPVKFNSDDGTFSFRNEGRGSIYIEGDGLLKYWTEKAIGRAGFTTSPTKTSPYIIIPSDKTSDWQLTDNEKTEGYHSIYALVSRLNSPGILSI